MPHPYDQNPWNIPRLHGGPYGGAQMAPVLLSTRIPIVGLNTVRSVQDITQLINPFKTSMLLDEIRFQVSAVNAAGVVQDGAFTDLTGVLHVQLDMGRTPLTKGFVPVWALGKQLDALLETSLVSAISNSRRFVTWRLPKPLFVPPGEFVIPQFKLRGDLFNPLAAVPAAGVNADVRVTYFGRSLPSDYPWPKNLHVPYVAAWSAPVLSSGDVAITNYEVESTEADLVNSLNEPLRLQRFLGRLMTQVPNDSFSGVSAPGDTIDVGSQFLLVRMGGGTGGIAVRDEVPFHHLFSAIDKAWTVGALLPPKSFFQAFLRTGDLSALAGPRRWVPQIAMVGWREVQLFAPDQLTRWPDVQNPTSGRPDVYVRR